MSSALGTPSHRKPEYRTEGGGRGGSYQRWQSQGLRTDGCGCGVRERARSDYCASPCGCHEPCRKGAQHFQQRLGWYVADGDLQGVGHDARGGRAALEECFCLLPSSLHFGSAASATQQQHHMPLGHAACENMVRKAAGRAWAGQNSGQAFVNTNAPPPPFRASAWTRTTFCAPERCALQLPQGLTMLAIVCLNNKYASELARQRHRSASHNNAQCCGS
jgi:hypothetical protein